MTTKATKEKQFRISGELVTIFLIYSQITHDTQNSNIGESAEVMVFHHLSVREKNAQHSRITFVSFIHTEIYIYIFLFLSSIQGFEKQSVSSQRIADLC